MTRYRPRATWALVGFAAGVDFAGSAALTVQGNATATAIATAQHRAYRITSLLKMSVEFGVLGGQAADSSGFVYRGVEER